MNASSKGSCEYDVYVRDTYRVERRKGVHFQMHYTKRKCHHPGTVLVGTRYYCRQHARMLEGATK